jgi:hypothetical protein
MSVVGSQLSKEMIMARNNVLTGYERILPFTLSASTT